MLFGGTNADEIAQNTKPNSIANLARQQVAVLAANSNAAQLDESVRRTNQLVQNMSKPNAALGYTLKSLMDHPTTFISNVAMASTEKRNVDIPV